MPVPLPPPEVRLSDVERIRARLRSEVGERPALRFILEGLPEDLGTLPLPDDRGRTARATEFPAAFTLASIAQEADALEAATAFDPLDFFALPDGAEYVSGFGTRPDGFAFDAVTLADGPRPVPRRERLAGLREAQASARERIGAHADDYAEGRISLADFRALLRREAKDAHVLAAVAARGGAWADMTKADWGRVGNRVRGQYAFADRFVREVAARAGTDSPYPGGSLRTRAEMYADASSASFAAQEIAAVGFDPASVGVYPGDGSTRCLSRCRCSWSVRVNNRAKGNFTLRWTLGGGEHCPNCLARRRLWTAVKVRGGRLVGSLPAEGTFRGARG